MPVGGIHHGLSKAGNDHIHIVVGLVREDGSKARVNRDQPRAQRLAGELERKSRAAGPRVARVRATPAAATPRATRSATRPGATGRPRWVAERTDRGRLERTVRACATAAAARRRTSSACCASTACASNRGLPPAARDRVGGYAVALPPAKGKAPVWFSGGRLARDLTLPRHPRGRRVGRHAGGEHRRGGGVDRRGPAASRRRYDPATHPRPRAVASSASQELGALRDRLRAVGPGDRAEWARIAGDAAGVLAAWSLEAEPEPGPLAAAAAALGRSAQLPAWQARTTQRVRAPSAQGAALLFAAAAQPSNGALGWMVLLRQMANLAKALHDAHAARGDLQRAQQIERAVRSELEAVNARLERRGLGRAPGTRPRRAARRRDGAPRAAAPAARRVAASGRAGRAAGQAAGHPPAGSRPRSQPQPRRRALSAERDGRLSRTA